MKTFTIRKFKHHLFRGSPYYIDSGSGCRGTFRFKEQAEKVIEIINKQKLER